jgi:protein-S-isoprenylcysteine O-methyltransferase Ste14
VCDRKIVKITTGGFVLKSTKSFVLAVILTLAVPGEIVLSFFLFNEDGNITVRNIGWVILWISGAFGWLPIFALRKWGMVPKGKSYIHTTTLVDRGVYAIVRHPQYLAGMLIGTSLALVAQHWMVAVLGAVTVLVSFLDTFEEDTSCIEKFGEEYGRYSKRVPSVNFILGIARLILRKSRT